jgi:UDP-N-acetylmuramoyl-tripeptide--D-alanyl-D-alanine ligase
MTNINPIIQWWVTPKLPREHIFIIPEKRPKGLHGIFRVYSRKWLFHPIKRRVAKYYLLLLQRFFGLTVIGITGSAGKTSTKDMVASVLSQAGETISSYRNIDPVYNIPTTILKCRLKTRYLVLEMGIEFPGEMDFYLWLAQPSMGAMANIYWTHTEFLGSLDDVIKEKGRLTESLPRKGFAILNIDDPQVRKLKGITKAKIIWYGLNPKAQIKGRNISITKDFKTKFTLEIENEKQEVKLSLLGQHFVSLALAAASVGQINGMDIKLIKKGLEKVRPQPHRMIPLKLKDGTILIDDSYNANPIAVMEAIRLMSNIGKKRRKILILGEMKELGRYEEKGHREVGKFAVEKDINLIITLGSATRFTVDEALKRGIKKNNTFVAEDKKELLMKVKSVIKPEDIILVKGSRSLAMEEIVEELTKK